MYDQQNRNPIMIGNMSVSRLLGLMGKSGRSQKFVLENGDQNIMMNELTLERIKDLIIEAYAQVDLFKREKLLVEADSLERQLVTVYRSRGLKLTANNITHTLQVHKKNQFKRS